MLDTKQQKPLSQEVQVRLFEKTIYSVYFKEKKDWKLAKTNYSRLYKRMTITKSYVNLDTLIKMNGNASSI